MQIAQLLQAPCNKQLEEVTSPRCLTNCQERSLEKLLSTVDTTSSAEWISTATVPEYDELIESLPWAVNFYRDADTLDNATKITPYYTNLAKLLGAQETKKCDTFLKFIEARTLSNVLLVGILRLTKQSRSELPHWEPLKAKVYKELVNRGFDPVRKLRGL
ncbi:hypothetical protein RFA42_000793 [Vibrio vulnificus]|uniref:hypothetical protein n=1 Tax=Vibrio vulnificus TaxID=672 RepID=UPI001CDC18F1|nr:hypothetical protein [Vibrio vulnificus]EKZ9200067.1 hypothetical protein [Vibrio vulnificus]MCA3974466.1 hypothetical protein [Vibrio vulnificus]HDY7666236.1 hypothetical protein [Vibrio vulnificus]HDY7853932.1 hypothetical protein [Vibrio vulnificus]